METKKKAPRARHNPSGEVHLPVIAIQFFITIADDLSMARRNSKALIPQAAELDAVPGSSD